MSHCKLAIHMEPNAKKNEAVTFTSGYLRLKIAVKADDNNDEYGNEEIISFLSGLLEVGRDRISIMLGKNFRIKLLAIDGLSSRQVHEKLKPHLKP
ncbi:MAG: DUF167 domain-containing protein [Dehalococcoidia bacterium]